MDSLGRQRLLRIFYLLSILVYVNSSRQDEKKLAINRLLENNMVLLVISVMTVEQLTVNKRWICFPFTGTTHILSAVTQYYDMANPKRGTQWLLY